MNIEQLLKAADYLEKLDRGLTMDVIGTIIISISFHSINYYFLDTRGFYLIHGSRGGPSFL